MADFASNFTARYVVQYSTLGIEHTMQFRIARGSGPIGLANMVAKVGLFLSQLAPVMFTDWTIMLAKYSVEDSAFFTPATLPTQPTGAVAVPAQPQSQSILSTSFVGISSQGHKARLFVYGLSIGPENTAFTSTDDFRVYTADTADIADAITVLNDGAPSIVASDDNNVLFYSYVNTKYNDFHLRHLRG